MTQSMDANWFSIRALYCHVEWTKSRWRQSTKCIDYVKNGLKSTREHRWIWFETEINGAILLATHCQPIASLPSFWLVLILRCAGVSHRRTHAEMFGAVLFTDRTPFLLSLPQLSAVELVFRRWRKIPGAHSDKFSARTGSYVETPTFRMPMADGRKVYVWVITS